MSDKAICAKTPEDLLPDGIDTTELRNPYTGEQGVVRKGTVGAALTNIHLLNGLLKDLSTTNNNGIENIMILLKELLPSLKIIGIFNLFPIQEWLTDYELQPGKTLLALAYLRRYKSDITPEIESKLCDINEYAIHPMLKCALEEILKSISSCSRSW